MRQPKVHDLKIDQNNFMDIVMERKLSEVRLDDRGYAQGDYLFLRETTYTGREMKRQDYPLIYTGYTAMALVKHIHTACGMEKGWVVISIKVVSKVTGGKHGVQ